MENPILNAVPRKTGGKGPARQLRLNGAIPGVYYRRDEENISFAVNRREFETMMRQKPSLLTFTLEGDEPRKCIIRELQLDPVDDKVLHIDLLGVKSGQKLTITVPVHLLGTPQGVKTGGGILEHGLSELEIECLPNDIPHAIEVDVSSLNIGQSLHVKDLNFPQFRFWAESRTVLATVVPPVVEKKRVEEEAPPEAETPPGETEE